VLRLLVLMSSAALTGAGAAEAATVESCVPAGTRMSSSELTS
jgi:hypothetical protein